MSCTPDLHTHTCTHAFIHVLRCVQTPVCAQSFSALNTLEGHAETEAPTRSGDPSTREGPAPPQPRGYQISRAQLLSSCLPGELSELGTQAPLCESLIQRVWGGPENLHCQQASRDAAAAGRGIRTASLRTTQSRLAKWVHEKSPLPSILDPE